MNLEYTVFDDKLGIANKLKRFLGYKIRYLGGWIMVTGNKLQLSGKTSHVETVTQKDIEKFIKRKS